VHGLGEYLKEALMQKVPIDLVKPGMVLAKPITNDAGMSLCAEDTELSETIIERLIRMNVSHVTLKGHPVDLGGESKTKEQKVEELKTRFSRVQGDPLMQKILSAAQNALMALETEREGDNTTEGGHP
jgi:hypothetical protein